jgi:hypothetical protein
MNLLSTPVMYGTVKMKTLEKTIRIIGQLKFEKFLKMTYNYYSELEPYSLKNTKGGEEYGINSSP